MQVEIDGTSPTINGSRMIVENDNDNHENNDNSDAIDVKDEDKTLAHEDLSLLCDLFYLPFEHGGQGIQLLQEFNWLKSNAHVAISKANDENPSRKADVSIDEQLIVQAF